MRSSSGRPTVARPLGWAVSARRAMMALRLCSTLCGCWRKTRSTSRRRSTNAGFPYRGVLGKYVPPQNGSPSGVRNMVSGPAAVLAQVMQRRHVDLIDVGALLAVDLDVDEQFV